MKDISKYFTGFDTSSPDNSNPDRQFDQLEATTLFCAHCKQAVPVRKKLLLILPDGEKYDYICPYCGNSVGTKIEKSEIPDKLVIS